MLHAKLTLSDKSTPDALLLQVLFDELQAQLMELSMHSKMMSPPQQDEFVQCSRKVDYFWRGYQALANRMLLQNGEYEMQKNTEAGDLSGISASRNII